MVKEILKNTKLVALRGETYAFANSRQAPINRILTISAINQNFFQITTIIMFIILLYQALFNFNDERQPEIQEEELEVVALINPDDEKRKKCIADR